jgi:isoquinoline 1-oxidoreductase alpha subunit
MIKLRVNGVTEHFNGDPKTPSLWYLRDTLGLTGTKYGCGVGLCGACTVHQNGNAIRSCITPVANLEETDITTIEGLGKDGIHVVQKAWIEHDVPQCGYCQPGQIMSAAALLASNSKPSDDDIDRSMSGNICRCGTYQRIRAAIKAAAEELA